MSVTSITHACAHTCYMCAHTWLACWYALCLDRCMSWCLKWMVVTKYFSTSPWPQLDSVKFTHEWWVQSQLQSCVYHQQFSVGTVNWSYCYWFCKKGLWWRHGLSLKLRSACRSIVKESKMVISHSLECLKHRARKNVAGMCINSVYNRYYI